MPMGPSRRPWPEAFVWHLLPSGEPHATTLCRTPVFETNLSRRPTSCVFPVPTAKRPNARHRRRPSQNYGEHAALRGFPFLSSRARCDLRPHQEVHRDEDHHGFLSPTSGQTFVDGHEVLAVHRSPEVARLPARACTHLPRHARTRLSAIRRSVRGLGRVERAWSIERVADQCGITPRLGQQISRSQRVSPAVGLAQALLHSPPIPPSTSPPRGSTPTRSSKSAIDSRDRPEAYRHPEHTHSQRGLVTCDRVIIINRRLVADGSTDSFTVRARGGQMLHVVLALDTVNPDLVLRWPRGSQGRRPRAAGRGLRPYAHGFRSR